MAHTNSMACAEPQLLHNPKRRRRSRWTTAPTPDSDVTAFLLQRPCLSAKKRTTYFTKSDSDTESDENSGKVPKKRSFKKKANAMDSNEFELGPDWAPANAHLLGTSESGPDPAPALTHHCTDKQVCHLARICTSHQSVAAEEEIAAIAMPIERQGELW